MEELLTQLSSFDPDVRRAALAGIKQAVERGEARPDDQPKPWLNLHLHTFHSFNYRNWSPSRVVFEGWRTGLKYVGTVDFDTLAALDETLAAAAAFGLPATGGFESRVFIEEYKDRVINSPGEPGIYYLCGKGFRAEPKAGTPEQKFFTRMKETAQARNRVVIERLNEYLSEVKVDYERDVLPLTPSGNPTERHIVLAYQARSESELRESVDRFWAGALRAPEDEVRRLRRDRPEAFQEKVRNVLIKRGGPGYITPEPRSFPRFSDVVAATQRAGGVPVGTWLDGTSDGERDPAELTTFLAAGGIRAVAIIPERNWNLKNDEEKREKVGNLRRFMGVCVKARMPVVCGTEMNKFGQPFVDDFTQPVLAEYLPYFLDSAAKIRR